MCDRKSSVIWKRDCNLDTNEVSLNSVKSEQTWPVAFELIIQLPKGIVEEREEKHWC